MLHINFDWFRDAVLTTLMSIHRMPRKYLPCSYPSLFKVTWGALLMLGLFQGEISAGGIQKEVPTLSGSNWFHRYEAGGVHQFQTGLDAGGDFEVNRFITRFSIGYQPDYANSTSLSFGYMHSAYNFEGVNGLQTSQPWDGIHSMNLSAPMRRSLSDHWSLLAIPSLRSVAEDNGDFNQSITGGVIAGASYSIRPGLNLGPGFGVMSQLEDSVNVFPIILIDWDISEKVQLQTGRGFGASQGPGLTLIYALNDSWDLMLGGRYERFRFRLNQKGSVPNGVGEDRVASINLGASYTWNDRFVFTLFGGFHLFGQLELDDAAGNEMAVRDYDSAPVLGIRGSFRF